MKQLLEFWLGLCLLRNTPQQLPSSHWLLGLSVACYYLSSVTVTSLAHGIAQGLQMAVLELLMLAAFVAVLLYLAGKPARVTQTLAALTGAGTLLSVPALLLTVAESSAGVEQLGPLWLVLMVWSLLITAHVMRHALSSTMLVGAGVAVLYIVLSTQVFMIIFPQPATG